MIKLVWFLRFGSQQDVVADHECSRPLQMKRGRVWLNGFVHLSRLTRRVNLVFYSALIKGRLFRNDLKHYDHMAIVFYGYMCVFLPVESPENVPGRELNYHL